MGNTILAHTLFSCERIDLDLENFFSPLGDSHRARQFNDQTLVAHHWLEFPTNDLIPVLTINASGWFLLLQYKMSYSKWHKQFPNLENWHLFFENKIRFNEQQDWQEFYNNLKDPSWPSCVSQDSVSQLPQYIQHEISNHYNKAKLDIITDQDLLEFLSITYYDLMCWSNIDITVNGAILELEDYLNYDIVTLQNLAGFLGWKWNESLSEKFFNRVLEVNDNYLTWLKKIKTYYFMTVSQNICSLHLEIWEQAWLIAKICQTHNLDIISLPWNQLGCGKKNSNNELINLLKERKTMSKMGDQNEAV